MITDEQIAQAYEEQYAQGFLKKEVRSYEVSLWTLQDDFITVLKWSNVENKGRIQDPQMTLSDDGTQNFTFSIPMYLYVNGQLEENPLWYNTQNGNIMVNLRKIKVIFNKDNIDKEIFEFLITKVTESHEADKLICNITCESLAFNELGKIGYNYNLSLADYELDRQTWEESGAIAANEPKQNVQYWCEKIGLEPFPANESDIDFRKWYYEIQMNWSSFEKCFNKRTDIVYEEAFVSSWSELDDGETVIVDHVEAAREKQRTVEAKESNVYNITQAIAKAFGIFCRYDYGHDINNHIIYRKVVFFNNFIHEKDIIDITYPYSSKKISREIDSTNITTKLYVNKMDDSSTLLGEANISYCSANRSGENYILNFDYLKETGNISEDQQEAIVYFEDRMHFINKELTPLENKIAMYEIQETELKAKKTLYTTSIQKDKEEIDRNSALSQQLLITYGNNNTESQYMNNYNQNNPDTTIILKDEDGTYYINLTNKQKGIKTDTVKIYRNYSSSTSTLSTEITGFSFVMDEYGNPEKIYGITPTLTSNIVYMTYQYEPHLYYDKIVRSWEEKSATDDANLTQATFDLAEVQLLLQNTREEKEAKITEKEELIAKFELQMGAALREGYWQPENYQSYGEHLSDQKSLTASYVPISTVVDNGFSVAWDTNLFDEEQKSYYETSVNLTQIYYPCINLSQIYDSVKTMLANPNCAFIFNNNYYNNQADITKIKNIECFSIGSKAIFSFIKSGSNIYPALILVGAKSMSNEQIAFMQNSNYGHPRIGIINSSVTDGNVTTTIASGAVSITSANWVTNSYDIVYPRIRFSSLMLKTDSTNLYIYFNSNKLEEFEDYYIRNRNGEAANDYHPEYLITIKPMYFIEHGGAYTGTIKIDYVLSNASTSIYLDALKISKENAYPKVSYTVDPNILNKSMIRTLYKKLGWLILINDFQLKLKEAFGYISKLNLNLDFPDKDTIEVKNYTTKFEDLFSSIVAQTEQMQRSAGLMASLAGGRCTLSADGVEEMLTKYNSTFEGFFERLFREDATVQDYLASLFEEAAAILSDSNYALSQVRSLNSENFNILNGFTKRIQTEMVPTVFRQASKPTVFKTGDVWIETNSSTGAEVARYIATMDSSSSSGGHGWVKTYNGSLAQIEGAAMNVDTASGIVDILAQNQININSGNAVNIAADGTVNIYGGNSVNIGGTTINIGAASANGSVGGVNIVATAYNTSNFSSAAVAKVLINPQKITMAGAQIEMFAGTANGSATAIKIDGTVNTSSPTPGIWMGSSKSIELFSGTGSSTGSSVSIKPDQIIMGVVSGSNASVFQLIPSQIVMATGTTSSNFNSSNVTEDATVSGVASLTGMKLTKSSFGLAVTSNNNRTVIIADSNGFVVGSGNTPRTSGSFVAIAGNGVEIGSTGCFKINAESGKFKIISNASSGNPSLYIADNATWTSASSGIRYIPGTGTGTGLSVKGDIIATSFKLGSDSHSLGISDVSGLQTALNDAAASGGFTISGLGNTTWNNQDWVSLTSTQGLLIGANDGIVIPKNANDASQGVYLSISDDGIELNGKHIKINGAQEWSRDDIVVMSQNATGDDAWKNSISTIESHQDSRPVENKKDWVLIQPYYNASNTFGPTTASTEQGTLIKVSGNGVQFSISAPSNYDAFGSHASWYKYDVSFQMRINGSPQGGSTAIDTITCKLIKGNDEVTISIPCNGLIDTQYYINYTGTTTVNNINLCVDDLSQLVIQISSAGSTFSAQTYITNFILECTTDVTTSKVPCTVYYYPKNS